MSEEDFSFPSQDEEIGHEPLGRASRGGHHPYFSFDDTEEVEHMTHPDYEHVGSIYVRLAEEAAEVAQAAMKCERFGGDNHHPDRPEETNDMALARELEDLRRRRIEFQQRGGEA